MTERPPFDRELVVRKGRRIFLVPLVVFAVTWLAMTGLQYRGFDTRGFWLPVVGFGVLLGFLARYAPPSRRRASVKASGEGLFVGGRLVQPRAALAGGFFQPMDQSRSGRPLVRLVDSRYRAVFEAELGEADTLAMLHALSLDPASARIDFRGPSRLWASGMRCFLLVIGMLGVLGGTGWLFVHARMGLLSALPLVGVVAVLLLFSVSSTITVGTDGVLETWRGRQRFVPMSKVVRVVLEGDRVILLKLTDGSTVTFRTSTRQHRDAIAARIRESLTGLHARCGAGDLSLLLARRGRSASQWLDALETIRETRGEYRTSTVHEDALWRVVEDVGAPEDARAGAAISLRRALDDLGKTRVRLAAEATASPKLRMAFEAAFVAEDDAARLAINAFLTGDDGSGRQKHA